MPAWGNFSLRDRSRPHNARCLDHRPEAVLRIGDAAIRTLARNRGPRRSLAAICMQHAIAAAKIRGKGIDFRQSRNHLACEAYSRMPVAEFQALNARQAWANWRTIPRNLAGLLPWRPLLVVDLCCGVGDSTEVLAYYCASGSMILGLEFNPAFVEAAQKRRYYNVSNQPVDVAFSVQTVLEPFRDDSGKPVSANSVDLINASGAIGCHFDCDATRVLASHCARVLKRGGIALIDAGPDGTAACELISLFAERGFRPIRRSRSCLFDRYWQVCLQKNE